MTIIEELRDRLHDAAHCGDPDRALDYAVGLHIEAASIIEALTAFQSEAKALIAEIFIETSQTEATTSSGKAYVTRPSVRISYDHKGIDELCALDDDLAGLLAPYRRETPVAGTLTIRPKQTK